MEAICLAPQLLSIQAIEDSFVAAIRASPIGQFLVQCETLPADMSPAEIGDRLRATPGAFVAFGGGPGLGERQAGIEGKFTVFAVTGQGANEEQRRRGSAVAIGAYSLLTAIITVLHGNALPTPVIDDTPIEGLIIGAPYMSEAARFWSEDIDKLGLSIYGAIFTVRIKLPPVPVPGNEGWFRTFVGQISPGGMPAGYASLPLPEGVATAEDRIVLIGDDRDEEFGGGI